MSAVRWHFYRTANDRDIVREELLELGVEARAAVAEAMKRVARNEHFPYEQEHIDGDLCAVRVFLAGSTYRVLYAREGAHDHILLGLHALQKKDRKLPVAARRLAERRLRGWRSRGAPSLVSVKTDIYYGLREWRRCAVSDVDDLDVFIEEQRRDPEFARAYEDAQTRSALLAHCVQLRKEAGLTQADVARAMGTTQSAVSELEAGAADPRLGTLQRYARAVGARIDVSIHTTPAVA